MTLIIGVELLPTEETRKIHPDTEGTRSKEKSPQLPHYTVKITGIESRSLNP